VRVFLTGGVRAAARGQRAGHLGELVRTSDGVRIVMTYAKARRELGYRTRPLREGLEQTLAAG
jgi:nucleoside-diphosphate-sugar epimerase